MKERFSLLKILLTNFISIIPVIVTIFIAVIAFAASGALPISFAIVIGLIFIELISSFMGWLITKTTSSKAFQIFIPNIIIPLVVLFGSLFLITFVAILIQGIIIMEIIALIGLIVFVPVIIIYLIMSLPIKIGMWLLFVAK